MSAELQQNKHKINKSLEEWPNIWSFDPKQVYLQYTSIEVNMKQTSEVSKFQW